jgi:RND family efflux transporter MFP subunit
MIIPKKVLGASLLVLILAAGGYFLLIKKGGASPDESTAGQSSPSGETAAGQASAPAAPDQKSEPTPLPVKVETARKGDLIMTLKSPGEAYTERNVALKAEVGGAIKILAVAEGRHVREGEVLLELDDTEYRLNLESQEAVRMRYLSELHLEKQFAAEDKVATPEALQVLARTQAAYEKSMADFQAGQCTQAELEKAEREYELALIDAGRKKDEIMATTKGLTRAELDVKIAKRNLEKTKLRAPFAGILTEIKVSPHERIEAGREICTLVDVSRIKVKARVLESEIGKMKVGREVDLTFSAYPGKSFKGVVGSVSPVVSAEDKTCAVHVAVANPDEALKPGMHAEVEIAADIYTGRLLVPQDAILVRNGRKLVFVVENGSAKWRYIEVGLENEKFAEVLPSAEPGWGVTEGDQVIVEGHFTLAHDAKVSVKKP